MKYRTPIAAAILAALEDARDDALDGVADTKKNGRVLNSKQEARANDLFDQYVTLIRNTLASTPVDGDTAEVDGVPATNDVGSGAGDQDHAAAGVALAGALFGGFNPPGLHIEIHGDVTINS